MTTTEILKELETMGNAQTKKIFSRYGAPEPIFGVKIGDLKKILKRVKKNHALSLALYDTGNSDAMYLAGLMADEKQISKQDLQRWVKNASWFMHSEYTVAWVAAESPYGWELGLEWIESGEEKIAAAGWSTLSSWMSIRPDSELDLKKLEELLDRIAATIHSAPDRVRYAMNGFVIACGISVAPLSDRAIETATKIGEVKVNNIGGSSCDVPAAVKYIQHAKEKGKLGAKKKMARC